MTRFEDELDRRGFGETEGDRRGGGEGFTFPRGFTFAMVAGRLPRRKRVGVSFRFVDGQRRASAPGPEADVANITGAPLLVPCALDATSVTV